VTGDGEVKIWESLEVETSETATSKNGKRGQNISSKKEIEE